MDSPVTVDAYKGYEQWKQWSGSFELRGKQARYYAAEFRGVPLRDSRVLEIGFGDGSFMAWAKGQGARITGLEINDAMLEAAHKHGFEASNKTLAELAGDGRKYDLIAAFDVLEHWSTQQLLDNLAAIRELLADGGLFLARFPNGQSPYGRVFQHGDFTHQSILSGHKVRYLATVADMEVVRVANACRVSSHTDWFSVLRHRWMALRRRWIERRLSRLYGMPRLPLDPNLVAVFRKPQPNESIATEG